MYNTRMFVWVLLAAVSVSWGINENFEGQTPPSTNQPPTGWKFVNVANQVKTLYEAVADHGGIAGRIVCDTVILTQYPPGYLVNTTAFDPTLAISGSYDFKVEAEGVWSDGMFLFGDILNGHTANYYLVKYQWNGAAYPTILMDSAYPATTLPTVGTGKTQIVFGTWYKSRFTWVPTSGTTGVFTTITTQSDGTLMDTITGTITLPSSVYFGFGSANDNMRVDNVAIDYKPATVQIQPAPGAGSTNVALDTMLKWGFVPADYPVLNYDVWFGTDPNQIPGATWKQLVSKQNVLEVDPASPASPWGPALLNNTTYYWRVDAYEPNTVGTKLIPGARWAFTTLPPTPIVTGQPQNALVEAGVDVTFAVTASDATSYKWYKNDVLIPTTDAGYTGVNTATLKVLAVDSNDDGWYHCVPENSAGPANPPSNKAGLAVKRLMAHWKFDKATDQEKVYTDDAENHDAPILDPNHVLTYVPGVDGDAIMMDAASVANGGAWDPSGTSNQITVSCWVNMNAVGRYQGIAGKAEGWGTTSRWSWRTELDVPTLRWFRNNSYGPNITLTTNKQWQFICMTVGSTETRAYVNGVQIAANNFTLGAGVNDPIWIGRAENAADRWFNGAIDDLRIYNYAIRSEDIVDEYNRLVEPDISLCLYPTLVGKGDINGDCMINLFDLAELSAGWLDCGLYPTRFCK